MQSLSTTRPKSPFKGWVFRLIYLLVIAVGVFAYVQLRNASSELDHSLSESSKASVIAGRVRIGDATVVIPSKQLLEPGKMWTLASRSHPLKNDFTAEDLVPVSVAVGGDEKLQVSRRIEKPLEALFDAAEASGHELMVSSAFRSIADQQATYDSYVKKYGETMAKEYVLPPGTSEHHTGLAVDLSDSSGPCQEASDNCSLGMDSAAWLVEHAPQFGFVLRYPDGKKDITGVKYEWWHFRYVGVPLAKALSTTDLTLDEALEKMQATAR